MKNQYRRRYYRWIRGYEPTLIIEEVDGKRVIHTRRGARYIVISQNIRHGHTRHRMRLGNNGTQFPIRPRNHWKYLIGKNGNVTASLEGLEGLRPKPPKKV